MGLGSRYKIDYGMGWDGIEFSGMGWDGIEFRNSGRDGMGWIRMTMG